MGERLAVGVLVLVIFALATSGASVVSGQPAPPGANGTNTTNTTNETTVSAVPNTTANATNETNGTANETNETTATPGGRGSTGGGWLAFGGPGEFFSGLLEWIANEVRGGIESVVDAFTGVFVGVPAPGTLDDPRSFMLVIPGDNGEFLPQNGWWDSVAAVYLLLSAIALPGLALVANAAFGLSRSKQRDVLPRVALAFVGILFGFPFLGLLLHGADALVLSIAPSGNEFLASGPGITKLGVGVVIGFVLIIVQTTLVGVAVAVLIAIYAAVHIAVALWPIAMVAYAAPVSVLNWVAYADFGGLTTVIGLRFFQAVILRLLFEIDLAPISQGAAESAGGAIVSLAVTVIGLLVAFLWAPKMASSKLIPAMQIPIARRAHQRAKQVESKAKGRAVEQIKERYQSARGDGGDSGTTPRSPVGGVTTGNAGTVRRGGGSGSGSAAGVDGSSRTTSGSDPGEIRYSGTVTVTERKLDRKRREINRGFD